MNICIIGWYGTETLGDRAILGGIFRIFSTLNKCVFSIGSLFPFFTNRTLLEEKEYYSKLSNGSDIYCFNVKNRERFRDEIKKADIVVMGGGPLMDMYEMELVEEAFKFAKKKKKQTIILGCGVGPLKCNSYKKILVNICKVTDLVILRDNYSKLQLDEMLENANIKHDKIYVCHDPAFLGVDKESIVKQNNDENYAIVNLRDYTYAFSDEASKKIQDVINEFLNSLCAMTDKVYLLPNHTFYLGGDDRLLYSRLTYNNSFNNLMAINRPLNLQETFEIISGARICVGMRYHAILFQTILNGNNYILDYTEKNIGKTKGFLDMIPNGSFYENRYISLHELKRDFDFGYENNYDEITEEYLSNILLSYQKIIVQEVLS